MINTSEDPKLFIRVSDIINQQTGKTFEQENLEKVHNIPLSSLVELPNRTRLYVVGHIRDCDGSPLYRLAAFLDAPLYKEDNTRFYHKKTFGSYSEEVLTIID
jgi:hypothetical protein